MVRLVGVLVVLVLLAASYSRTRSDERMQPMNSSQASLSSVLPAEWDTLASRRIFFGHQSVGRDIVDGMRRVLQDNRHIAVRVVAADDPGQIEGPAFIEARIGRNRLPETKSEAFGEVLARGFGEEPDAVAMYKYCYVDVLPETDPDELFADYVARTEALHAQYPDLTIVHMTMPLHTAPTGFTEQLKTMLGMSTQTYLNIKRNRYNDLLRERYAQTEPLFDLALIESTKADGSRAYTRHAGRNVYMLAPEWTHDGGHLTDEAQYRVAERLLVFLARMEVVQDGAVADSDAALQ